MPWSTRELAELAGTTLRTVRHYHDLGLLDLPARGLNGYKQYGVGHLRRLLRIRRLVQLGLTLPQVGRAMGPHGLTAPELLDLDQQITATVHRLQAAQKELAALVGDADLGVHHLAAGTDELADLNLSDADDNFLAVLTDVVSSETGQAYVEAVRATAEVPVLAELDTLDADADERARADLATRVHAHVRRLHAESPLLRDLLAGSPFPPASAQRALAAAVQEEYNPAQVDVLRRVARLVETVRG